MRTMKKILLLVVIVSASYLALQGWDDKDLFTTVVRTGAKPNVMFLQDNSGSMAEGIYHPDYNPNRIITDVSTTYANFNSIDDNLNQTLWHIRWYYQSGSTKRVYAADNHAHLDSILASNIIRVDSYGQYIKVGDWILQHDENNTTNASQAGRGQSNQYKPY